MASHLLHHQIARNKRATAWILVVMFLLVAAMVFFIGLAWGALEYGNVPFGFSAILAMLIAGIYILVTYNFSVQTVLAATKARPAGPKVRAERLLLYRVEEMSIASGIPMPKVYVQDSKDINAFATGKKPEDSIICVTTGALEQLDQEELEGVIAHEISHIGNNDILLGTITVGVVGAIALLSEILLRSVFWGGMGRGGGKKGGGALMLVLLVVGILFAILAPLFAKLTYLAMSRRREYLADATGAQYTRNPHGLASALRKIQADLPDDPRGSKTAAALYLANPFKRALKGDLWATHPPLDERIGRLERM